MFVDEEEEKRFHLVQNDLIKRALAKQAEQFQRQLKEKDDEITRLISSALRQSNIEKLHLEKRLLSSSSSETTTNGGVSEQQNKRDDGNHLPR